MALQVIAEYRNRSRGSAGDVMDACCQSFGPDVEAIFLKKLTQNKGWDEVAACLRGLAKGCDTFLSRDLFIKITAWFKKFSPRAKYEYLEALFLFKTDFEDTAVIEYIRPFILPLLTDISTVAVGRGKSMKRIPMVQIFTLKLLKKHSKTLGLDLLLHLVQSAALASVLEEKTHLQVREEAYTLLLQLCWDHLNFANKSGKEAPSSAPEEKSESDEGKLSELKRLIAIMLLRGLSDPDTRGMEMDMVGYTSFKELIQLNKDDLEAALGGMRGLGGSIASESSTRWQKVGIRKRIYEFFNGHFGLSDDPYGRLRALMVDLFEPRCCDQWLQYSSHLLLALCGGVPGYSIPLFERNLASDSAFRPFSLPTKDFVVSGKLGSHVPLFSLERKSISQFLSQDDLGRLYGNSYGTSRDYSQRQAGFLRFTQELDWTQTQHMQGGRSGGVGSRATQDVGLPGAPPSRRFMLTQSYLGGPVLGNSGAGGAIAQTERVNEWGEKIASGDASGSMGPPVGRPTKRTVITTQRIPTRFVRATSSIGATFGASGGGSQSKSKIVSTFRNDRNAELSLYSQVRQTTKKAGPFVPYRQYRDGELPDISIPCSDIIRPLAGLCLRDSHLSGKLFVLLFEMLYSRCAMRQPDLATEMQNNLGSMLRRLSTSGVGSSDVVGAVLGACLSCLRVRKAEASKPGADIALLTCSFNVGYDLFADVALQNLNFYACIHFLEEQLLIQATQAKAASAVVVGGRGRGRKSSSMAVMAASSTEGLDPSAVASLEAFIWRQLSRLYDALGEKDVLLGLTARLSSMDDTRKALDAELSGDFAAAVKIYQDLLTECAHVSGEGSGGAWGDEEEESESQGSPRGTEARAKFANVTAVEKEMWDDRSIVSNCFT